MNFSEAMFYEYYLTSDFHTNTAGYFKPVCLLVKIASKTVIRPILPCGDIVRQRVKAPLEVAISPYFDLTHPSHPRMNVKDR